MNNIQIVMVYFLFCEEQTRVVAICIDTREHVLGVVHSIPARDQLNVTVTEEEDAILTCNPTVPHFLFGKLKS